MTCVTLASYAISYRKSSQSRNQQYTLEWDVGQVCVNQLHPDMEDLGLFLRRLATLEQKARYGVEVLKEDSKKAIFIFTVVAAIFLPLSFVTSYLSMNIVDIRDMDRSQSSFWAIAFPDTFGLVALATLVAYRDAIREWVRERNELFQTQAASFE